MLVAVVAGLAAVHPAAAAMDYVQDLDDEQEASSDAFDQFSYCCRWCCEGFFEKAFKLSQKREKVLRGMFVCKKHKKVYRFVDLDLTQNQSGR